MPRTAFLPLESLVTNSDLIIQGRVVRIETLTGASAADAGGEIRYGGEMVVFLVQNDDERTYRVLGRSQGKVDVVNGRIRKTGVLLQEFVRQIVQLIEHETPQRTR